MRTTVEVLAARSDQGLALPAYAHPGDAGLDLFSADDAVLAPAGGRVTVATGLRLALPHGFVGLVHPRSGLAAKHGVTVVNAPGTVDAGYRGEIKVTLLNTDPVTPFTVHRGDRIAQLLIQRVETAKLIEVERLPGSVRGEGGFGSTGVRDGDSAGPGLGSNTEGK
ncbi:MAG: dUTP diphosphatase [Bifidobacteriaceae bacterium]|nr:dUTP diphosphatase [Bifidobacteriaceae bacterium]